VQPTKSPNDEREYRYFRLTNGMQALVVSDPQTDQAAASVNVSVGSANDPAEYPGLAHFLEHMLFLGTEKYPDPGEYQAFIARHGGNHNAYTDYRDTNYFLEIETEYLAPALDRFAQFFTDPLFTPEYVDRERNAVHSEYQMKINSDGWRKLRATKQVVNPKHPHARFSIGALETLPDGEDGKLREALLAFYAAHYSADRMSVVVLGREPVDQLEQWVTDRFSPVPRRETVERTETPPLFEPGRLPLRLDVLPVKSQKILKLTFPIPSPRPHYRSKPVFYLASLIGHEGRGSLLSDLKNRGWADALSASNGRELDHETTFDITVKLTDSGLDAVDEVIGRVFAYLDLLRRSGTQRWLFDEQQKLMETEFRFQEQSEPLALVRSLSRRMARYPVEDLLWAPFAMDQFTPERIAQYLESLTPNNVLVVVSAPGLETDQTERWMGTRYRVHPIPPALVSRWRNPPTTAGLTLPERNEFVPEDLSLKLADTDTPLPEQVVGRPGIRVWFKQDTRFNVPRANVRIAIRSRQAGVSPLHQVLTKLYVRQVEDQLAEYTYPALLAGLGYTLDPSVTGLLLDVSGYSDKLDLLLARVLSALSAPELDPERFEIARADLARTLKNFEQEDPYDRAIVEIPKLLIVPYWSKAEQHQALADADLSALEAFIPAFLSELEIEVLVHGNLARNDALDIGKLVTETLVGESELVELPDPVVLALGPGEQAVREVSVAHSDSAVALYYQGRRRGYGERARVGLLSQVLSSPFYQELRTNQQLGYLVFASPMPMLEVPGMYFVVQSPVAGPLQLEDRIATFLQHYRTQLAEMPDAELARHKAGLVSRILEQSHQLTDETARLWNDIRYQHYDFDSRERLAEAVRDIDKAELLAVYDALLLQDPRALLVRAIPDQAADRVAQSHREGGLELVTDALTFKRGRASLGD
jgi:secreted Zn-dependent insulinase-like peptidase